MATRRARSDGKEGGGELRRMLRAKAPEAIGVLVMLMNDEGQKPELRMKAAESILDRACGKASSAVPQDAAPAPPAAISFEGVLEEWSR